MEVLRPLFVSCLLFLSGCDQVTGVCEGRHITEGVKRAFATENENTNQLVKRLQLQNVKVASEDVEKAYAVCTAQIVIPTEFSTLHAPIEYRVGTAAPGGESVFMYFVADAALQDFIGTVQKVADNIFGKAS